jgi:hypothetical protein
MRYRLLVCSVVVASAVSVAAQDSLDFKDSNTRDILRRSRQAVGGSEGVEAVGRLQSLVLSGLSRIPANKGLVECELEIRILLPDRYLRIDRAPFGERRSGFDGKRSLSVISERGRTTLPPDSLVDEIVRSERERMLQLLLGSTAYLSPRDVIMVRSVAGDLGSQQAQPTAASGSGDAARRRQQSSGDSISSPSAATGSGATTSQTFMSGTPNPYTFDVSVRPGAAFRFSADPATFMPAKLTYNNVAGDEVTIVFSERRLIDGLKVPYRITTTSRGKIIDDLLLERVDINPKLTKADFER